VALSLTCTRFVIEIAQFMMQKSLFLFECRVGRVVSPNVPESMSRRRGLIGKPITSRTTQRETYEKASHKHTHRSRTVEVSSASGVTFRPFAPKRTQTHSCRSILLTFISIIIFPLESLAFFLWTVSSIDHEREGKVSQ
jgi:hypothetical protein